ncbi:hypothetical protein DL771_006742 [Monosporascus sp. 5C6A]|nr:hypothetical protein DL771_006742 [Monosporascus sp. 5C6A]
MRGDPHGGAGGTGPGLDWKANLGKEPGGRREGGPMSEFWKARWGELRGGRRRQRGCHLVDGRKKRLDLDVAATDAQGSRTRRRLALGLEAGGAALSTPVGIHQSAHHSIPGAEGEEPTSRSPTYPTPGIGGR